jgi:hypothetical protein
MNKKYFSVIACLTVLSARTLCASNIIWIGAGGGGGSWDTDSNWQGGVKPGSTDIAVFGSGATAGTVTTSGGATGGAEVSAGITFNTGGWILNGFFANLRTLNNNVGDNTIAIVSTGSSGYASTWNIAAGTSLTITGATRSGSTYSINIGHNSTANVTVSGGGTLILGAGIFGSTASKLYLGDITLVINTAQIFSTTSGTLASYVITDTNAVLSIKTTDLNSLLNNYGSNIVNNSGTEFTWTQSGDYWTFAAIPEPSTYVLLCIGTGILLATISRKRNKIKANRR